ncbi:MAG: agmatine deiminase family protein [Bacteroidetes bacterium]|nr:agmatine deiminase family protein [Bacteroidota bacterium]
MAHYKYQFIIVLIFLLCGGSINSFGQFLPRYSTEDEKKNIQNYRVVPSNNSIKVPPSSPVRTAAEWEEIQALVISWKGQYVILREIIKYAKEECEVFIVCPDSNQVKSSLTSAGITLTNLVFMQVPSNSIWIRDYGQWSVYTNDVDSLLLVDWIYNRNRPLDDTIPAVVAAYTGIPLYETSTPPWDMVHTGGNFMTDGLGTGFSSKLILDENGPGGFYNPTVKTEAGIDSVIEAFMGINRFIKLDNLPYDVIHHIDMHMKLLDEETILLGEYPNGVSDGPQIEANMQYILSNHNSVFGTPYRFVRIQMPPHGSLYPSTGGNYRTFTNAIIVNKTIIVPTYELKYDSTALDVWREAMPGYNIVGINSNSIIPSLGAIHCIVKQVATDDPLLIVHQRLRDTTAYAGPYTVDAKIQHRSAINTANIYYRSDTTQEYQTAAMSLTDSATNTWSGQFSITPGDTIVYYYVEADANSGKTQVRPMTAPDGYWSFKNHAAPSGINQFNLRSLELENVFPNPSKGITCIPVYSPVRQNISIDVIDLFGRKIVNVYNGETRSGDSKYFINTMDMNSGFYFMVLSNDQTIIQQKFFIR